MLPLRSESYSDIIIFYIIFFNMVCNFLGGTRRDKKPFEILFPCDRYFSLSPPRLFKPTSTVVPKGD